MRRRPDAAAAAPEWQRYGYRSEAAYLDTLERRAARRQRLLELLDDDDDDDGVES
jgi:hypothetical protein